MNFGEIDKYLFLGGGQVLFDIVCDLKEKNKEVCVVTSRRHALDKVKTDGLGIPLQIALEKKGVLCHVTANIINDQTVLNNITNNTMGISISAEWIFKRDFIQRFNGKLVNLHGTCLPAYRGGGGASWLILNNDRNGGSTIHLLDEGLDTGAVVKAHKFIYPVECKIPIDFDRFAQSKHYGLMKSFLEDVENNKSFIVDEQDESKSSYWPRLNTKIHGYINWNWDAEEICYFINAFDAPYQGASTFLKEKKVYLKKVQYEKNDKYFHPFQRGLIFRKMDGLIYVAARKGTLILADITCADGIDVMTQIKVGDRFYTPYELLENALNSRAFYIPEK